VLAVAFAGSVAVSAAARECGGLADALRWLRWLHDGVTGGVSVIATARHCWRLVSCTRGLALRREECGSEERGGDLHVATGNERRK